MKFNQGTGGDSPLTHSISGLPSTLPYTLNNGKYKIEGTPTVEQTIKVTYTVTDADNDSCTDEFNIVIAPRPIVDNVPTCPSIANDSGTTGVLYSYSFDVATGGDGTLSHVVTGLGVLSYSVANGKVTISGTVTTDQTINATYTATDSDVPASTSDSCSDDFSIEFTKDGDTAPKCPADYTIQAVVGSELTGTVKPATGGNGELTHVVDGLPAGELSFDAQKMQIKGTPTSDRTITATYRATDSDTPPSTSESCTTTISIVVAPDTGGGPVNPGNPGGPGGGPTPVVFAFDKQIEDLELKVGQDIPAEFQTLPGVTGNKGTVTYSLSGLPEGMRGHPAQSPRFMFDFSTEVLSSRTVTYSATDTGVTPHKTISQYFTISVEDVPEPGTFPVNLRLIETLSRGLAEITEFDHNMKGTEYWSVLTTFVVEIVDPYDDPETPGGEPKEDRKVFDYESYEFRIWVASNTGVDVGSSCEYPSPSSRASTGWIWGTALTQKHLSRCRIGNGASTISLDVQVRGVPSRRALNVVTVTPVKSPHHSDNTLTYRLCGPIPTSGVNFVTHIDNAADLWDASGAGVTFPDSGSDVPITSCNDLDDDGEPIKEYTDGYIDVRVAYGDNFEALCGEKALACAKHGALRVDGLHYRGQRIVFRGVLKNDMEWVSTEAEVKAAMSNDKVYAQTTMIHEFGHTAGLGHTGDNTALMRDGYYWEVLHLTDHDKSAMGAIYNSHSSHQ